MGIFSAFLPPPFSGCFPSFPFGFVQEDALTETQAISTLSNHKQGCSLAALFPGAGLSQLCPGCWHLSAHACSELSHTVWEGKGQRKHSSCRSSYGIASRSESTTQGDGAAFWVELDTSDGLSLKPTAFGFAGGKKGDAPMGCDSVHK